MRKIALVLMLAFVGAMVPLSTAATANPGAGTINFINATKNAVDFCVNGAVAVANVPSGGSANFTTANDNYTIDWDNPGSNCAGVPNDPKQISLNNGENRTAALNFTGTRTWLVATNNQDPTEHEHARYTLHNNLPTGTPMAVCINGKLLVEATAQGSDEDEFQATKDDPLHVKFYIGFIPPDCNAGGANEADISFAPGTNFVQTFTTSKLCTSACVNLLLVGEKADNSNNDAAAFCSVLPQLQGVDKILNDLFLDVVPGNFDTYPSVEEVENGVGEIQAILDAGDEVVPAAIADTYRQATDELRQLLAGLKAAGYDLKNFPTDRVEQLQQGLEEPSGPTPEDQARQAELGAWFTANCTGGVEAQPTFTG